MSSITLRPPTFSKATTPPGFKNPTISWLSEEWHVTHSTLPMWKSKRNVRIQYTPLEPSDPSIPKENTDRLDDYVTYQSLKSDKISKINGIDKASGSGDARGEWDWRGKGWCTLSKGLGCEKEHWKKLRRLWRRSKTRWSTKWHERSSRSRWMNLGRIEHVVCHPWMI